MSTSHVDVVESCAGAETGAGGRIRDTHATGTGSIMGVSTAGYCVGNLQLEGGEADCEDASFKYPESLASPLQVCFACPQEIDRPHESIAQLIRMVIQGLQWLSYSRPPALLSFVYCMTRCHMFMWGLKHSLRLRQVNAGRWRTRATCPTLSKG